MSRTIACLKGVWQNSTLLPYCTRNITTSAAAAAATTTTATPTAISRLTSRVSPIRVGLSRVRHSHYRMLSQYDRGHGQYKSSIFVNSNTTRLFSTSSSGDDIKNVVVPQLAESLSEGDLKWDKAIGDTVSVDEVIGAIETDKTSVPIHSPVAGVITEMLAEDGDTVKPGQTILKIQVGEGPPAAPAASGDGDAAPSAKPETPPAHQARQEVRQASSEQQRPPIDSTPKQTIPVSQIKQELASSPAKTTPEQTQPGARTISQVKMNRMRLKIASRLKEAQNTYAMLTTFNEIDMGNLVEMRQKYKDAFAKKHSVKLGFMSAFVKASAYALKDQPVVNAVIDENQILYRDFVDISVAVATPKGLVVPVLRNVETMNFADIEKAINALGEKARNNTLSVEDMDGGTFTISNGGVFGSLFGTPIINSPQSAILGMHAINDKPAAVNGEVKIRPIMVVALTYDHRLIDGREAVTFLKKIKEVIEDPRVILLDL